jgi:hypothetical protein
METINDEKGYESIQVIDEPYANNFPESRSNFDTTECPVFSL